MKNEFIKQAEILFDAPEKWTSFIELKAISDELMKIWTLKISQAIGEYYAYNSNWGFDNKDISDIRWFLPEFDKNSCCIALEGNAFSLWLNNELYDNKEALNLISTKKFQPLRDAFERLDKAPSNYILRETGNWHFNEGVSNGQIDLQELTWYFGNRTDEFIEQLAKKIERFNNDVVRGLIKEINNQTKRK